jgi:3-hydroxyacyl-[acyl-carrier-protein] dehydratase
MLLGDFFTITETHNEANTYTATIIFNPKHAIYDGHFPGQPVVPGVCQTQILLETMSLFLSQKVAIKHAHMIKFLQLINPNIQSTLSLKVTTLSQTPSSVIVNAELTNGEEIFYRFRGELGW